MANDGEGLRFTIDFDPRALRADLIELERLSQSFGNTLVRAFASAVTGGRKLSDVLRSLALSLSRQALTAALRPLGSLLGQAFAGVLANSKGGAYAAGRIKPFARGGIVGGPTLFALRGGAGLMGEAGPEAVLPLARGADGRLGVRAEAARSVTVNLNITTPDVEGFRRSGSQVAALMLRALERGQRNL